MFCDDDGYVLEKKSENTQLNIHTENDPGKAAKHGREEPDSSRAQKLAAAGLLDALPFLDPASLKSCIGGPPGPCWPGTGRSSRSALRPSSPATTAAICWSRVAGRAPRPLGEGATADCEWRDGPIGYLGSGKQASLARNGLARQLWEERCSDDKNVAEMVNRYLGQEYANCRRHSGVICTHLAG